MVDIVPNWNAELAARGWWHSFEFPTGESVTGIRSIAELRAHLAQFELPENLSGKRVLDIGAWDGWFSFEMERRGAEVTAIDCWDNPKFRYAHRQFGSQVRYCIRDVYELTPAEFGQFDIVLFFGVLYHLKHPLLALERVCAMSRDTVCVESYVLDGTMRQAERAKEATMSFYEADELGGQTDNWVAPNAFCLLAWCRTAGFARASLIGVNEHRAYVVCHRTWAPAETVPSCPTPVIEKAIHNLDGGINFSSARDEYISCWFRTAEPALTRHNVQPTIGDWGSVPLSVQPKGDGLWQANFKLPPGLAPGFHEVRLRTSRSTWSNSMKIALDVPAAAQSPRITGAADGDTWTANEIALHPNGTLALWIEGLPENADVNNFDVTLGGRRLAIVHIASDQPRESRQVNVEVPADFPGGTAKLCVRAGDTVSNAIDVTVRAG